MPSRWLVILSLLMFQMEGAAGKGYRWFCDIQSENLETLALDRSTGLLYTKNPEGSVVTSGGGGRSLQETSQSSLRSNVDSVKAVQVRRAADENVDTSAMHEFRARKCWCANNERQIYPGNLYYCIEPYTHCAIPAWWMNIDLTPGCVNRTRQERFARGVWPVVLVWFAAIFTCVCCTKVGHQVYDYVLGKIIPGYNGWVADRILRRHPGRANRLIREHWRRRRVRLERRYLQLLAERRGAPVGPDIEDNNEEEEEENDDFAPIHELVLKTRIYMSPEESASKGEDVVGDGDAELDDDNTCTICFGPIEDGDRVGELACDHVFHVECLKQWLARRNICPLCQMPNAATPRSRRRSRVEEVNPVDDDSNDINEASEEQESAPSPSTSHPETHALPAWRGQLELAFSPTRNRRHGPGGRGTPGLTPFH